ncbi:MAG: alpha/beta fold hydrolase [Pseudomonadota bacterium]
MTPVVLVHGFMGGSRQWRDLQGAFHHDTHVLSVDLPGFGENANLDAPSSIPGFAGWVIDRLSSEGIDSFHLLGHSMGGMIAQEIATAAPERVDRLILYGTGATGVLPGRFETIEVSKQRAHIDGPRDTARRIAATWFLENEHAPAFEECAAIAERSKMQAICAGLDAMQSWSGVSNLPAIKATTLVVWGDHDRTYPWQQIEQLWTNIDDSSLAVIPKCAHAAHLEKPEIFGRIVQDFLTAY